MKIHTLRIDANGEVSECSEDEAGALAEDMERCHVAHSITIGGMEVSTVFTPFCTEDEEGRPQCFETIVLTPQGKSTVRARYTDRGDALSGHQRVVEALS